MRAQTCHTTHSTAKHIALRLHQALPRLSAPFFDDFLSGGLLGLTALTAQPALDQGWRDEDAAPPSPAGVTFPISAAILRGRRSYDQYDQVLEAFSKPLSEFNARHWTPQQEIAVTNETGDLYRYFDATVFAEYVKSPFSARPHRVQYCISNHIAVCEWTIKPEPNEPDPLKSWQHALPSSPAT